MRTNLCLKLAPLLLVLAGCGDPGATDGEPLDGEGRGDTAACTPTAPRRTSVQIAVTPEAGEKPIADVVAAAQSSIRLMVYILDDGEVLEALKERAGAGVRVQAILDQNNEKAVNQDAFDALTALGAEVHWADPSFKFMHAKFLVVDDAVAVVSTGNFSKKLMARERNLIARDRDAQDVAALAELFDADFAGSEPDLTCNRLLVSPVSSRDRLIGLLHTAKKTLTVESMQLADQGVRDELVARARAGVQVRVLLADPSWIGPNADAATFLAAAQIPVRRLKTPMLHIKNVVVDGKYSYLGSENLSSTSLDHNREVGIVVSGKASLSPIVTSFENDWSAATAF